MQASDKETQYNMAAELLALLSQQAPNLQTRKGLILTGLQNDFLSPEGKLPVSTASGFVDRLREFVPAFREYGDVIWIRSHFQETREVNRAETVGDHVIAGPPAPAEGEDIKEGDDEREESPVPLKKARMSNEAVDRPVTAQDLIDRIETGHPGLTEMNDEDEELFLTETAKKEPCCIPGSFGAEYATQIKDLVDPKDIEVVKTYYSAFGSTSLLLTLRSRLITELFIGGCLTNLSVFATAMDAARYGIKVTLVEDCLGYRRKDRHELAMKQLPEITGADVFTSTQVIERLKNPPPSPEEEPDYEPDDDEEASVGEDAERDYMDLLLEADNADEDDHSPPIVRPSHTRSLAHRYAFSAVPSLPEAATAGSEPFSPIIEPSQSSSTRAADASGATSDDHGTAGTESNEYGKRGKRENSLERWITHTTNTEGVAGIDDESSRGATSNMSQDSLVNQIWREQDKQSYLLSGRSTHPGLNAISVLCGLDQSTVNDMESMMNAARLNQSLQDMRELNAKPLFGDGKQTESGGSRILYDLLPPATADTIFEELSHEVKWQKMYHQTGEVPRLVCCQGSIDEDGSMPVYRHPSDQTLPIESWTPAVDKVRTAAELVVGHPLNHALIQLYRGGADFISEHSDKTLDIVKDSFIVNVSFGACRTMRLRTKRSITTAEMSPGDHMSPTRTTYRVPMPHNSIIVMSLPTNAEYLHGINADKRPAVELTDAEKAFDGQRISLTFRNIGTFLDKDSAMIWGQGATAKTKNGAKAVINANVAESEKLVRAFGAENQSSHVDWDTIYGDGFDVLHLK